MSLVILFFYWWVIPALVLLAAMALWRRAGTPIRKGLVIAVSAASFLGLLWLAEGEKWLLDRQVRELCAKDGGVRVYETVKLPAAAFDEWGMPKMYHESVENKAAYRHDDRQTVTEFSLGKEHVLKRDTQYYRRGNPDLFRMHTQVFRRYDKKILGESVFYKRGGGDLPGPWHGSSFMCPELGANVDVLRRVFVMEKGE